MPIRVKQQLPERLLPTPFDDGPADCPSCILDALWVERALALGPNAGLRQVVVHSSKHKGRRLAFTMTDIAELALVAEPRPAVLVFPLAIKDQDL
jgi:hypothetical protein